MEYHGIKIDLLGLAAVLTALSAIFSKLKANSKKKEEQNASKNDLPA